MTNSLITSVASFTCCAWFAFNCIHTVDAANIVQRILSVFHFSQIWRAFILGWLHHVPFLHLHLQVDSWWDTMGLCQENRSMDSCALQSLHSCLQWLIWSCINVMSEQNVLGQAQSLDVRSYFLREMRKACKAVFSFEVPDQWCWISTATVPAWGARVAATFNGIVHIGRLNNCLIREVKDTRYWSVSMVFSASYLLKDRPSLAPNSNRWMGLISWPIDRQQCCQSFEQKPGRGTRMVRVWAIFVCNA